MAKFKKKYDHKNEDVVAACGFNEELYKEILLRAVDIWENTETISKIVEKIEKYCDEYDQTMLRRFLIMQFVSYIILKDEKNQREARLRMIDNVMTQKGDVIVFAEKDGELEKIDSFDRNDNSELFDKITREACDNCDQKDDCKSPIRGEKGLDDILKH